MARRIEERNCALPNFASPSRHSLKKTCADVAQLCAAASGDWHKVLGRGRPSHSALRERWRARVLKGRRAVAELGS